MRLRYYVLVVVVVLFFLLCAWSLWQADRDHQCFEQQMAEHRPYISCFKGDQ